MTHALHINFCFYWLCQCIFQITYHFSNFTFLTKDTQGNLFVMFVCVTVDILGACRHLRACGRCVSTGSSRDHRFLELQLCTKVERPELRSTCTGQARRAFSDVRGALQRVPAVHSLLAVIIITVPAHPRFLSNAL